MALNSPGTQVTIIDESQYLPAAPNSVPLIVLATASNKANAAGTGIAVGTTSANANKLYQITSQRDLVTYFGNPFFYKTNNGTPIHGYELNEYGLLAAYSTLGSSNLAYVIRADIDLAGLVGRTGRPSAAPDDGQYWLNTLSSTWGIFEFNRVTGTFTNKVPVATITSTDDLFGGVATGVPKDTIGNIGDYAINLTTTYGQVDTYQTYWYKAGAGLSGTTNPLYNTWVRVGSTDWQKSIPALQGTVAPIAPTLTSSGSPVSPGVIVFSTSTEVQSITGFIDNNAIPGTYNSANPGDVLTVTSITGGTLSVGSFITGVGIVPPGTTPTTSIPAGVYISAFLGASTGGVGYYQLAQAPSAMALSLAYGSVTATAQVGVVADLTTLTANTSGLDDAVAAINTLPISGAIPNVYADAVDGRLAIYATGTNADGSVTKFTIAPSSTALTLSSLGLTVGTYSAPSFVYGTNAQQPLWRTTDATPSPTGSVWIKSNNVNAGVSLSVSQYSASTASWTNKTVRVAESDWAVNAALDASGGKSIPLNTVYAQASNSYGLNSPIQLFTRAARGPSVFIGSTTPGPFVPTAKFNVSVSLPGSATLDGPYTVTMIGSTADAFIVSWTDAKIPYTTAVIDPTGSIVITHTEGGVIILDDSASVYAQSPLASPVVAAGFSVYDPATLTGTLGVKLGPLKGVYETYADTAAPAYLTPTNVGLGAGINLKLNLYTLGTTAYFTIPTGLVPAPTGYKIGDVVSVTSILTGTIYQLRVDTIDATGAPTNLTLISGTATPRYTLQMSNWEVMDYIADSITPVNEPATGTKWFHSVANQVDILTNYGGKWYSYNNKGYDIDGLPTAGANLGNNPTGPITSASMPSLQVDGTPLVYGDLWIDTGDLENYPVISRWQQVGGVDQWVLLDTTDQTTENGVLFADARWGGSGSVDPVNDTVPTIDSLLTNIAPAAVSGEAYTDLDAPSPSEYPSGTLLFNTRRSGYVVKEFRSNYFNGTDFADAALPTQTSAWVTVSGNKSNGAAYMGRKAQRAMVVQALKVCIDTTSDLREDQTFFNLIVCPGYPELQPNMVALNNDRNNTSYIIGDSPLRLAADANDITAWATNSKGATSSGEDGLVTRDTYLGVYYPSGITTDLTGTEVVVPASHMILRTMLHNDSVAYPWFAPAGQRRGVIDNATNIGYINAATGEVQTTQNRVALRDIEYTNYINPIAFFNNLGLLNFGNKNTFASQSALDRTNVSRLVCYLRDRLAVAVRPFLFEPNDSMTRTQARSVCQTLLADIMSKRGIYDYVVVCDETNNTPARIDRNELWIDIAIEPVKAVEFIYIPVRILNTGEIGGL